MKMMIEVEEGAVEKLDEFIKWCYTENIESNKEDVEYTDDWFVHIPDTLMQFAKPIAKAFTLYPYNQKKVRHP